VRKADPAAVKKSFGLFIDELTGYLDRMDSAATSTTHAKGDLSRLAETVFFLGFVAFERFHTDLMIAYMNRDFSAYQADLLLSIQESVRDRYDAWAAKRVAFDSDDHVTVSEVAQRVAATGRNLSFSDSAAIKEKGRRWVSSRCGRGIASLSQEDERLIDAAKAIRNFIAHRSDQSKGVMNTALDAVAKKAPANAGLGRGKKRVDSAGVYLKAVKKGERRVKTYLLRLKSIAVAM